MSWLAERRLASQGALLLLLLAVAIAAVKAVSVQSVRLVVEAVNGFYVL
jgi:hypothetical protein